MKLQDLTKEQQRIACQFLGGYEKPAGGQRDIEVARQYVAGMIDKAMNPPPLTIPFVDDFATDEERLDNAFPAAMEALESGRNGYEVAGKYFISAFHAAMNLGRYIEAIVATYGMPMAGVAARQYVEKVKSHHTEGSDWFTEYLEKAADEMLKDIGLVISFSCWYK